MGSCSGFDRPLVMRVLDALPAEAKRTAAVHQKIAGNCADPVLYTDPAACLRDLADKNTDILILDLETIGDEAALEPFAARCPTTVIIAVSARGSVSRAVSAMRSGAHDFLTKPFSLDTLCAKVEFQLDQRKDGTGWRIAGKPADAGENGTIASSKIHSAVNAQSILSINMLDGHDGIMRGVCGQIRRIAPSQAPVFVTGESGTGKELCARAIHDCSDRSGKPFVKINCAAIPNDLIESEIFGSSLGAFSNGTGEQTSAVEQADGGTLFLDEIGELDLLLQSKLLQFLQTGTFQRLGDNRIRKVDARIICATNRDPLNEITAGRFREDLYYRLHVLPIHLPPLRERREDIVPLATFFLERHAREEGRQFVGFDADAEACLLAYGWPGNIRQLENTIRQIVVMNDGHAVELHMLPLIIRDPAGRSHTVVDLSRERARSAASNRPFAKIEPLWAQERRIIETALEAFDGNIAMAAAALEISPSTIYRKRQSWLEKIS
ncbi:sigma-54 dependent transcriptional regulator [Roseibium sp. RKSG952]|uniref:sigma-54-dependent transcriptional regulator n=1 Tax=Roseibium sp. RKSG952 TaxID=2529384 RepID=UPI0012BD16CC|nr:sigma-54 dependent transcriptional regulator [Roseibium sp. RKSG952]MTI00625.1 sigma-54-dependent Fis family transcriptional regulator [Roseibium sp. RKSG952]